MELDNLNLSEDQLAVVKKYVQSETDKVRTDYSNKLRAANAELEKYKPKQKSEEEQKYEERLAQLEQWEKKITAKEKKTALTAKLKEKNLPVELADYLNLGENVDADLDKIGTYLGTYFLASNHKPEGHSNNNGITKEEFAKMGYVERSKIYRDNPALYSLLSK